jgi:serine phosphatase RsbU (regulator of sigma subunit)/anti-sigma regulatory factor (Ser/Thr protein kinase)
MEANVERGGIPQEAAAILGATLDGLKRAAHGVEVERRLAEALQLSLLPKLPVVPGLRFASRYRAGSADARIGGDWYDAFPLRGGKVGIAIGDVVGQGVQAAARMAHLQSALRAYALEGLRPAVVLERMNGFVLEGELGGMVTLLYGIVDPDSSTLKIATAGHPPPLICSSAGTVVFADMQPGTPLGVTYFPSYGETMAALEPWSTILLYTDGLAEGPDLPLADGLEALRRSVAALTEPEELCRRVLASMDRRAGQDDLALLAVQLTPPEQTLVTSFPAGPAAVASMRRAMSRWLQSAGADDVETYEILLACGEACVNTIAHAHSAISDAPFEVRATREGPDVAIVVSDTGTWRLPPGAGAGRGLTLMRELMDDVQLRRGSRGTEVTMRRRLARVAPR